MNGKVFTCHENLWTFLDVAIGWFGCNAEVEELFKYLNDEPAYSQTKVVTSLGSNSQWNPWLGKDTDPTTGGVRFGTMLIGRERGSLKKSCWRGRFDFSLRTPRLVR